jgi:hypothetical protein
MKFYPGEGWLVVAQDNDRDRAQSAYDMWMHTSCTDEQVMLVEHIASTYGKGDL